MGGGPTSSRINCAGRMRIPRTMGQESLLSGQTTPSAEFIRCSNHTPLEILSEVDSVTGLCERNGTMYQTHSAQVGRRYSGQGSEWSRPLGEGVLRLFADISWPERELGERPRGIWNSVVCSLFLPRISPQHVLWKRSVGSFKVGSRNVLPGKVNNGTGCNCKTWLSIWAARDLGTSLSSQC